MAAAWSWRRRWRWGVVAQRQPLPPEQLNLDAIARAEVWGSCGMTAEERNRRIKYGHDVPRWWIPDFNVSQELPSRQQPEGSPGCAAPEAGEGDDDYQVFERRRRQLLRREQARRRSRNLRLAQRLIAVLIAVVAYLAAGLVGLAIGVAVGVLLISLRLEF